jgi:hypothetical protein
MNVRPSDLVQPAAEMVLLPMDAVPNLDAGHDASTLPALGLWPLAALSVAIAATIAWNAFLLWQGAMFVLGWLGVA